MPGAVANGAAAIKGHAPAIESSLHRLDTPNQLVSCYDNPRAGSSRAEATLMRQSSCSEEAAWQR